MYRVGRIRLYLTIMTVLLIESTFLNLVSPSGIRPDLLVILVVFVALYSDWAEALEAGIIGGLIKGVMSTGSIILNIALLGSCGLFSSYCKEKIFSQSPLTQIGLVLFVTFTVNGLDASIKMALKKTELVGATLYYAFIPALLLLSIYTALVTPLCFFCFRRLFKVK